MDVTVSQGISLIGRDYSSMRNRRRKLYSYYYYYFYVRVLSDLREEQIEKDSTTSKDSVL